jgi:mannosyltransferase OCH1-like enzyme
MSWIQNNIELLNESNLIPRILHLIWVGPPMPTNVLEYIQEWKALMPDWTIRIWGNEDISETNFPEHIVAKILSCKKEAQKSDIMRYFIIEKYGGVYVDTDVKPHRSLDPIRYMRSDVVLCHDNDLTWEYIINAFFAAVPNHPLMNLACEYASNANLNTPDIHMYTGPRLLGEAVKNLPPSNGSKYLLLPTHYFYVNEWNNNRFAQHLYAHSWK